MNLQLGKESKHMNPKEEIKRVEKVRRKDKRKNVKMKVRARDPNQRFGLYE